MADQHGKKIAAAKATALQAEQQIQLSKSNFDAMPDTRGAQVHTLFASLYCSTTHRWLQQLQVADNPEFAHLVIVRFFKLYEDGVLTLVGADPQQVPKQWRKYHWLARRLTMTSPISLHLLLISLGARAHVRYDLGIAAAEAAEDYRALFGREADFERLSPEIIGAATADSFALAALDYIDMHHAAQTGWRRLVLSLYRGGLRVSRPLWLWVFQNWRRAAYAEARIKL